MVMLVIDKQKKPVGHALREYRIFKASMSQEAFAAEIGVAGSTVSFWETGQTKPSGEAVKAMKKRFPDLELSFSPSRERKTKGSGGARPHPKRPPRNPALVTPNAVFTAGEIADTGLPLRPGVEKPSTLVAALVQAYKHIQDPTFRELIEALTTITQVRQVARLLQVSVKAGIELGELAAVFEQRAKEESRG